MEVAIKFSNLDLKLWPNRAKRFSGPGFQKSGFSKGKQAINEIRAQKIFEFFFRVFLFDLENFNYFFQVFRT